jgi:hypothetical protein
MQYPAATDAQLVIKAAIEREAFMRGTRNALALGATVSSYQNQL